MNSSTQRTLTVGGLVVAAAAIGAVVFVVTGTTEVVWGTMISLPIIIVVGVAVYVRGLITRNKTSEQQYVRKRGRSVAEDFQNHLRTLDELRDSYPDWSPNIEARTNSLVADFQNEGVEIQPDSGAFELISGIGSADVQEFERLETEVERFHDEFEELFREFVRTEINEIEEQIANLSDVDLIVSVPTAAEPPATDPIPAYQDTLTHSREEADDAVETAIETIRGIARGDIRPEDVDSIEQELEAASNAADEHEYSKAVESVLEARDRLRDQFSGSFEIERERLSNLLDAVLKSNVDEYVDAEQIDLITEMDQRVDSLDSALELAELMRMQNQLREICVSILRSMDSDLNGAVTTLRSAETPNGYYNEPAVVDESLGSKVADIDDLERFTAEWADAAARLTDALETASTKASVIGAYDDLAGTIETKLNQTGEVTADDLPVRHAEEFLGLYNRRNPSVEFDPAQVLLRRGDVERYGLTVDLQYEHGGESRQATIEINGGVYSETKMVETHVAASVEFTDIPQGEYTLSADPGASKFGTIKRELVIEDDLSVSIKFSERSPRERLCSGIDQDMTEYLPAIESQVSSRFKEQGYVSASMDLPVRDEYGPCLIAIWGEQSEYDVAEFNDDLVVYDRSQLRHEVENTIQYNIEPGDELQFSDARNNFLSVPVPDEIIREMVGDLQTDDDVTTTKTAIKME